MYHIYLMDGKCLKTLDLIYKMKFNNYFSKELHTLICKILALKVLLYIALFWTFGKIYMNVTFKNAKF